MPSSDSRFTASISERYESHLVPLIFEPYAGRLVDRLPATDLSSVLEIACGTGVVTRALAERLPRATSIVATDLNQAMIDQAASVGTVRQVEWRQADAMRLPFDDATFDAVLCQFAAMFFPDRAHAFGEARRVLRPGGVFAFAVWDRIEENEIADVVTSAVGALFPDDPPRFLARTPHGYHDLDAITSDLARAGFTAPPRIETIAERSRAATALDAAIAYCHGTPLRNEIEERASSGLGAATDAAVAALVARYGSGAIDAKMQAHLVVVQR